MPRKKVAPLLDKEESGDFVATIVGAPSTKKEEEKKEPMSADEFAKKQLEEAMRTYDYDHKQSSTFLEEKGTYNSPTLDELGQLAEGAQDDIKKILRINSIVNKYTNLDDVIGMVVNAITTNLNDEYRLSYPIIEGRNKSRTLDRVREVINQFNEEVNTPRLIREFIPRGYMEGTVISYLRKDENTWTVDVYPLGVGLVAPYKVGGEPASLVDVTELKNRLQKVLPRKRNGKSMYFDDVDAEIKSNFPQEVYDAHKANEAYAKLNPKYTGILSINNYGRKYGVTPIFRALPSSIILETFLKSDALNAKARTKKLIYQLLQPILLGNDGTRDPLNKQQYAHKELLAAYKNPQALYTAPAYVSDVKAIELKGEMVNKDTIFYYLHKELSTLGVGFLSLDSGNGTVSSANISLSQLMRNINAIGTAVEDIFEKFYRQVLIDEKLPPEYAPKMKIIDSEAMELEIRTKLVDLIYSKLNCSLKTSLETLGIDYEEEVQRRKDEESDGIANIFKPRMTSFTTGKGSAPTGRPSGDDNTKKEYDQEYNKSRAST